MKKVKDDIRRVKSVSIDTEIWEEAGRILREVGMSRSRFVELVLRHLVKSEKGSFSEVTADIFHDVARSAVEKANKESRRK